MATKREKTALVLAGGGLTGAVYEIGALRAIDDMLVDRSVNDFDIYVGTSSGALVSAFLANGISPEEMLQVLNDTHPEANLSEHEHIFKIDKSNLIKRAVKLPRRMGRSVTQFLHELDDMAVMDIFWSFSSLMPPGFYDGTGLGELIRHTVAKIGQSNRFQELPRELYIIATNLDSGERAVFGNGYLEASIPEAVSASCAVPFLYQPVRIDGRDYIDGSLRGNASIDLAIEQGARLIVVINPMVPYDLEHKDGGSQEPGFNNISEGGFEAMANQLLRIILHSTLQYHIKHLQRAHKNVDIILIEPSRDDYEMFSHNIMRYSARLAVARHGFEAVTVNLMQNFQTYAEILARHKIPITPQVANEKLDEIIQSSYDTQVIQQILEARSSAVRRSPRGRLVSRLESSLLDLETTLDQFSTDN